MRYIPKDLAKEIRDKMNSISKLENGKRVYLDTWKSKSRMYCKKSMMQAIEKNAQIHSYRMENPGTKVPFSVSRNNHKKNIKEGIKDISDAMDWGVENFDGNSISQELIKGISFNITPYLYPMGFASYRKQGTTGVLESAITRPDAYKVNTVEMPNFVDRINLKLSNKGPIQTVYTAAYSHLHLARIHPFEDGNGRTSRTLQDLILLSRDMPVPVIEAGERSIYYYLIEKAIQDWKYIKHSGEQPNGATEGERFFYTFIAGKVNASIDKLIDYCN